MRNRLLISAVIAALCAPAIAGAQGVNDTLSSSPVPQSDRVDSRGPQASSIDRPSEAVRRSDLTAAAPLPATGQNLGEAKAQMAVGGAAIVVGALIGGDPGTVLMFGGALVGLYGLWNYLK